MHSVELETTFTNCFGANRLRLKQGLAADTVAIVSSLTQPLVTEDQLPEIDLLVLEALFSLYVFQKH